MSAVLGEVEADRGPPMTIPLRHFVVALGLLLAGCAVGVGAATGHLGGAAGLAHVHLLLAGWVCVTIMGAMTQFVPVWSGTRLHSRRLAAAQLPLVVLGLLAFAGALLTERYRLLPVAGALMALGFWVFVYNAARTLATLDAYDVTERHFAAALAFFLALTTVGVVLAVDLVRPVFVGLPVTRTAAVQAHATLAVFGAVLTTVHGALYQLATMFTQSDLAGVDHGLRRAETWGYPLGVVALAAGRLLSVEPLAVAGGVLVVGGVLAVAIVLARRLVDSRVETTPMLRRYAVAAPAMALWAALTLPAWLADPLAPAATLGAPGAVHLLTLGAVGFVVLGTLYHVVPFIVWVHRYADRLGYEPVPMIDDLYSDRVAAADLACLLAGGAALVVAARLDLPEPATAAAGTVVLVGGALFAWNLLAVLRTHAPGSLWGLLVGRAGGDDAAGDGDAVPPPDAGDD